VATVLVMPFYLAMIAAPKKQFTQQLLGSGPVLAAGAALYGVLLAAWNPLPQLAAVVRAAAASVGAAAASGGADALRASLPSMPAFAALFTASEVTVVAWVHLLLLDLLQARSVLNCAHKPGAELLQWGAAHHTECGSMALIAEEVVPVTAERMNRSSLSCPCRWVYNDGLRNSIPTGHSGGSAVAAV
jgi:hypothetical protein